MKRFDPRRTRNGHEERQFSNKASELNADIFREKIKELKEQATGKKKLRLQPSLTIVLKET